MMNTAELQQTPIEHIENISTTIPISAEMSATTTAVAATAAAAEMTIPITANTTAYVQSEAQAAAVPPPAPPPTTAARPPTSLLFSRGNLVSSRLGSDKSSLARPSTAVRAVGYAAKSGTADQRFNQYFLERAKQQTLSSTNAAVDAVKEVNPQIKYKNLEAKIIKLLEASIVLAGRSNALLRNGLTTMDMNTENVGSAGANASAGGVGVGGGGVGAMTDIKTGLAEALNKAKEAFSLDRTLHRFRDQHGENIFHNFELTYAVFFNLAEQYENNDMHIEALNTYSIMTKNKMFPNVNQLKLNMGNIYYKMGIYPKAIKMYRMALDSVPNSLKQLRLKITMNIGILFVRMGQYADAASSFEFIMSERSDIRSGVHLILCYFALGDIDKIKSTFRNLCDVHQMERDTDLENENNIIKLQQNSISITEQQQQQQQPHQQQQQQQQYEHDEHFDVGNMNESKIDMLNNSFDSNGNRTIGNDDRRGEQHMTMTTPQQNVYVIQALKNDDLAIYTKQMKNNEKRTITMIVDLISPVIEENYNDGYNWCIEVIKTSHLSWLANELELNKALVYLRQNDINQAIETLQMYDRKSEGSMTASALTNLTFIYINLGNFEMATHCVNQLNDIGALRTNAMALINASIIEYHKHNYAKAQAHLERALEIQPDNFEANYNLGLVALKQNDLQLAEEQFSHLKSQLLEPHSIQHSHVFYQLAKLHEKRNSTSIGDGNFKLNATPGALQSYLQVLGLSAAQIDSHLYEKVGTFYEQIQDHQEANQYYNEAYRINPSDITIASSIGSYYIKLQATEKALYYYERAVLADPNDPNLMLRIASCYRNSYMPPKQYLGMFEKVYARFPDNLTCVRALVQVSKSLGMLELHEKYTQEYGRLHKLQMERQQEQKRLSSASSGRRSSRLRGLTPSGVGGLRSTNEESTMLATRIPENVNISGSITSNFNGINYTNSMDATNFTDPLGPPAERPRTGMVHNESHDTDDEDINAESLLPI